VPGSIPGSLPYEEFQCLRKFVKPVPPEKEGICLGSLLGYFNQVALEGHEESTPKEAVLKFLSAGA
jgi:hypothetical protein